MVIHWDILKAGLTMCPLQRDGGVGRVYSGNDRRVGSGWKQRHPITISEIKYSMDGSAAYYMLYIKGDTKHTCYMQAPEYYAHFADIQMLMAITVQM